MGLADLRRSRDRRAPVARPADPLKTKCDFAAIKDVARSPAPGIVSSKIRASESLIDLLAALAGSSVDVAPLAIDPPARRRPFHRHATSAADRRVASVTNRSRVRIPVLIAEQTENAAHRQPTFSYPNCGQQNGRLAPRAGREPIWITSDNIGGDGGDGDGDGDGGISAAGPSPSRSTHSRDRRTSANCDGGGDDDGDGGGNSGRRRANIGRPSGAAGFAQRRPRRSAEQRHPGPARTGRHRTLLAGPGLRRLTGWQRPRRQWPMPLRLRECTSYQSQRYSFSVAMRAPTGFRFTGDQSRYIVLSLTGR